MEPDWNLGWNYSFLGFVFIGYFEAFFVWGFARILRIMIVIFQSRNGQIRVEK